MTLLAFMNKHGDLIDFDLIQHTYIFFFILSNRYSLSYENEDDH